MSDSPWVKYEQKVLIKRQSTGYITRSSQFLLPVNCEVNRVTNRTIWAARSPSVDSLLPETENVSGWNIDMVIKVFKDSKFTEELTTPVRLPIGTPLYVELSVDKDKLNAGARAKIIVENCVALPSLGATSNKHPIIKDQLSVDDSTNILRSPAFHKVQFQMETFKIIDSRNIYLSCTAYVCPHSDISSRCNNPAANAQHKPGASALSSDDRNNNLAANAQHKPGAIASSYDSSTSVVSDGYELLLPKLNRSPIYYSEDLPGLGPDDEVRIGQDDNKCYHILSNGSIRLYHNPRQSSTKAENPCLNQF